MSMEKANYNHIAGNSGWIYEFLYDFELENEHIMTYDILKQIQTETPAIQVYPTETITPKIMKDREKLVNLTDSHLLTIEQTNNQEINYGRSM